MKTEPTKDFAPLKGFIATELNQFPEATWDRLAGALDGQMMVFGWIDREDGRSDFLLLRFDAGELLYFATSSAKYSEVFSKRRGFDGHHAYQRVENVFPGVKAVRLNAETQSGKGAEAIVPGLEKHLIQQLCGTLMAAGAPEFQDGFHAAEWAQYVMDTERAAIALLAGDFHCDASVHEKALFEVLRRFDKMVVDADGKMVEKTVDADIAAMVIAHAPNVFQLDKCSMCGDVIQFNGQIWEHQNSQPRHPAKPGSGEFNNQDEAPTQA